MMRMIRGTVAALALAMVPAVALADTLADTLIAAYRNSNLLDQNRAVLRAADEGVAQAVASLRPVVTASTGLSYSSARLDSLAAQLQLQAQMTLFDFGRSQLAVESAKESVLATRQALINVEQQVLLNAVQAYVQVRLAGDIVALRDANLRLITQELQAAQDRFEVGEITRTEVAQAEARLAASRSDLVSAQGSLMIARENFRLAVGRNPGNLSGAVRLPRIPSTLDEARRIGQQGHPQVRQAQHQVTISELGVARAKAAMGPSINLSAGRTILETGRPTDTVSLGLSQTLYAGGSLSSVYRQSLASRDQAKAALHQTVAVVAYGVGEAWTNLSVAGATIEAADRQIRAAQTAFDSVREEARLGARTTLDVLDAEQELLAARTSRLSSEATRVIQAYALLASMGLLTVDHLDLGIPTYDPAAYYNAVKRAPATSTQGRKLDRVLEAIGKSK